MDHSYCTDAASMCGGICRAVVGAKVQVELWRRGTQRGRWARLMVPAAAALETAAVKEAERELTIANIKSCVLYVTDASNHCKNI